MKVRLVLNTYFGVFQKKDFRGHWRKFATIGNAQVAKTVAIEILMKLGHRVEIIEEEEEK